MTNLKKTEPLMEQLRVSFSYLKLNYNTGNWFGFFWHRTAAGCGGFLWML